MQDPSGLCCSAVSSYHRRTDSSVTQLVRISNLAEHFTVKNRKSVRHRKNYFI